MSDPGADASIRAPASDGELTRRIPGDSNTDHAAPGTRQEHVAPRIRERRARRWPAVADDPAASDAAYCRLFAARIHESMPLTRERSGRGHEVPLGQGLCTRARPVGRARATSLGALPVHPRLRRSDGLHAWRVVAASVGPARADDGHASRAAAGVERAAGGATPRRGPQERDDRPPRGGQSDHRVGAVAPVVISDRSARAGRGGPRSARRSAGPPRRRRASPRSRPRAA